MAEEVVLTGIGVGSRVVRAEVFRLHKRESLPAPTKSSQTPSEEKKLIAIAVDQLSKIYEQKIASAATEDLREILIAQSALATDPELTDVAEDFCDLGWDSCTSIQLAMNEFKTLLEGTGGEFGERIADLDEIAYRLCCNILGFSLDQEIPSTGEYIVAARDLTPIDTVSFTPAVVGVITEKGGPTSHTAIVCRSKDIPALVACPGAAELKSGDILVLDPDNSRAIINGELPRNSGNWWEFLQSDQKQVIPVLANVGSLADSHNASMADGIGLLRTELFFLDQMQPPTLEDQEKIYSAIFAAAPVGEIIVRTLDAGSDKPIPFLNMGPEENPALGVRGQRVAELDPIFYSNQLKAIAQAAKEVQASGKNITVSVMAPMISTVGEAEIFVEQARKAGLSRVGIMVEVPSIISCIPRLQGVLDFVSVGTNDLSQYLFAADRTNSGVAHLLNPWEPALLYQLQLIAQSAEQVHIKSGVCGEAASDPLMAIVLAGLGFSTISASISALSSVKKVLTSFNQKQCQAAATAALSALTAREAKTFVKHALNLE